MEKLKLIHDIQVNDTTASVGGEIKLKNGEILNIDLNLPISISLEDRVLDGFSEINFEIANGEELEKNIIEDVASGVVKYLLKQNILKDSIEKVSLYIDNLDYNFDYSSINQEDYHNYETLDKAVEELINDYFSLLELKKNKKSITEKK